MPLYEYRCRGCGREFEQLIRPGSVPSCPSCEGADLERLLSLSSVSSDATRQQSFNQAKQRGDAVRRDRDHAHAEYVRKHHDEHRRE